MEQQLSLGSEKEETQQSTAAEDHAADSKARQPDFERIQYCAYSLWERAGRPTGDQVRDQFWFDAEKLVKAEDGQRYSVGEAMAS